MGLLVDLGAEFCGHVPGVSLGEALCARLPSRLALLPKPGMEWGCPFLCLQGRRGPCPVPWPGLGRSPARSPRAWVLTLLSPLLFPSVGCRPGCLACTGAFFLLIHARHRDFYSSSNSDAGTNPGDAIAATPAFSAETSSLALFVKTGPRPAPRPACA